MSLISIVLTVYNQERYLGAAIQSILAQSHGDLELLVWNDGSEDSSGAIAQQFAQADQRVRVVTAQHQGRVAALQAAIAQTQGDYLGWVDGDDRLASTALAETAAVLNQFPQVGMVYTDYWEMDAADQIRGYGQRCRIPYSRDRLLVDFMTFHFRLLRRSVFQQVEGLAGALDFVEDYDLCLRLSEVTQIRRVRLPLYYYRIHSGSASQQLTIEQALRSRSVVTQALRRRGLDRQYALDLEIPTGRLTLRPRGGKPGIALLAALPLVGWLGVAAVQAESVVPAPDGTNTIVTSSGSRLDISGGIRSGANLFHSFDRFGLNAGQIANFIANPQLQNILGRVVGGQASIVDGRIQVTGGAANLYLINPAGIVFGSNASLNVPAGFTATTAHTIGFGSSQFNAVGTNNYADLLGNPTAFGFPALQPGTILNAGSLSVGPGQALGLLGGTVVNTGNLTAPGGQITVVAVPGTSLVRLSQPGSLLSLEIQPIVSSISPSPATLPQLLTNGSLTGTGLMVTPDGTVRIASSGVGIPTTAGTTIVAGQVDVSGTTGGTVNILGTQVGLVGAAVRASGVNGGGTVRVGGDFKGQGAVPNALRTVVDGDSTIAADSLLTGNGGRVSIWANQSTRFWGSISARGGLQLGDGGFVEVSGKDRLHFAGRVDLTAPNGGLGTLLLDPTNIVISNAVPDSPGVAVALPDILLTDFSGTDITISQATLEGLPFGAAIVLEATNDIRFDSLTGGTFSFSTATSGTGDITLRADADGDGVGAVIMSDRTNTLRVLNRNLTISGASLELGNLDTSGFSITSGGNVTLTARNGNLLAGNITTSSNLVPGVSSGAVSLTSNTGSITVGAIVGRGYGTSRPVILETLGNGSAGSISLASIDTRSSALVGPGRGGDVTVNARGLIRGTGQVDTTGFTIATDGAGPSAGGLDGTVILTHDAGPNNNTPFTVGDPSITLTTGNGLRFGISTRSNTIPATPLVTPTTSLRPFSGPPGSIFVGINNGAPTLLPLVPPPLSTLQDQPIAFTLNTPTGLTLRLTPGDADADSLTIRVVSIAPGFTLLVNGSPASVGTPIALSDSLQLTPPSGFTGRIDNAVSVVANDARLDSRTVPIAIEVGPASPTPQPTPSPSPTPQPTPSPSPTPLPTPTPGRGSSPDPCALTTCSVLPGPPNVTPTVRTDTTPSLERQFTNNFQSYFGLDSVALTSIDEAKKIAVQIEKDTGAKPAFLYIGFLPPQLPNVASSILQITGQPTDELELLVITGEGAPVRKRLPATRGQVTAIAQQFSREVSDPRKIRTTSYLALSQALYQLLVAPLEADLKARQVTNLVFLMDEGLRSVPVAALHSGQGFLIEQYSVAMMPSLSLTDTRYRDLRNSQVLGMGISAAVEGQAALPAVPAELAAIVRSQWTGKSILNETVTLTNLKLLRQQQPYGILHLATHADFQPGTLTDSYIQLWDTKLRLDQIRQLGWNNPQVDLLVLSACVTALGNREAELGFAGLAVQSGVKSAVASLWYVSDAGTTALMSSFYEQLRTAKIKSQALRSTQLALAKGQITLRDRQVVGLSQPLPVPPELLANDQDFIHPYFWSAFTVIGNPW
jgi:filamentous hemagglutinin family protein